MSSSASASYFDLSSTSFHCALASRVTEAIEVSAPFSCIASRCSFANIMKALRACSAASRQVVRACVRAVVVVVVVVEVAAAVVVVAAAAVVVVAAVVMMWWWWWRWW